MTQNLEEKVIEKLQKQGIRPIPRWHFLLKRIAAWGAFLASIIVGGLATGILVYQMNHLEWGLFAFKTQSPLKILLSIIPYFWLCLVFVFLFFAIRSFRQTLRGYRYRPLAILCLSFLLSVSTGALGYDLGFSSYLDRVFEQYFPAYQGYQTRKAIVWMDPENGLLAGTISDAKNPGQIELTDLHGKRWSIDVTKAFWRGWTSATVGVKIKIIGQKIDESTFKADEIRPWQGRRQGRGRRGLRR